MHNYPWPHHCHRWGHGLRSHPVFLHDFGKEDMTSWMVLMMEQRWCHKQDFAYFEVLWRIFMKTCICSFKLSFFLLLLHNVTIESAYKTTKPFLKFQTPFFNVWHQCCHPCDKHLVYDCPLYYGAVYYWSNAIWKLVETKCTRINFIISTMQFECEWSK